jgi:hypothetical protein
MPQQPGQQHRTEQHDPHATKDAAHASHGSGNPRSVTSPQVAKSAATGRWLEQRPDQEPWNAVARLKHKEMDKTKPPAKF